MKDPVVISGIALVLGTLAVLLTLHDDFSESLVIACFVGTVWFVLNTALLAWRKK